MTSNKELVFRSSQDETLVCVWFLMRQNKKIRTFRERKKINSSRKCMGVLMYLLGKNEYKYSYANIE